MAYNMQNMRWGHLKKSGPISKVDHRGIHRARPGYKFIISDLAQIEPRCENYLARNWGFLELCREVSVYEAAAIAEGIWKKENGSLKKKNPLLYALKKAATLALGYNAGYKKFVEMIPGYGMDPIEVLGTNVTQDEYTAFISDMEARDKRGKNKENAGFIKGLDTDNERLMYCRAWLVVNEWRQKNLEILRLWNDLAESFRDHALAKEPEFTLTLPSLRDLHYWNPQIRPSKMREDQLAAYRTLHPRRTIKDLNYYYGGKLCENLVQATARDVVCWHLVELCKMRFPYLFSVHDELVFEVPDSEAEGALKEVIRVMRTPPPWMSRLPLDCEAEITERYKK